MALTSPASVVKTVHYQRFGQRWPFRTPTVHCPPQGDCNILRGVAKMMDKMGLEDGEVIQHSMMTKSIERAQKKVEENNFGVRKRLLEYDDASFIPTRYRIRNTTP